jgi:two-component system chemotaxis sensor kinase CheA
MSDTNTDHGGAGIDLSQFYQVFFEEAGENLDRMEQQLLAVDIEAADDEELNSIFRCAHSVKGGAATFGFADVAELTHQMETLLDRLRRHELTPTAPMVDVLLQAGDALRSQLAVHQGAAGEAADTTELLVAIRAMVAGETGAAPAAPVAKPAPAALAAPVVSSPPQPAATSQTARGLELRVGPLSDPSDADNLVDLFKEIPDLGTIEPLDGGQASDGIRRFKVVTSSSDSDLLDLFTFHVSREAVSLLPLTSGYGFHEGAPGAPQVENPPDPGFGFFDNAPGSPTSNGATKAAAPVAAADPLAAVAADAVAPRAAVVKPEKASAALESSTLRVSVEKVDQLRAQLGQLSL